MAVKKVKQKDVGTVVQDFIDNDETRVVAKKVAQDNYTVGPDADGEEGSGGKKRKRKPS